MASGGKIEDRIIRSVHVSRAFRLMYISGQATETVYPPWGRVATREPGKVRRLLPRVGLTQPRRQVLIRQWNEFNVRGAPVDQGPQIGCKVEVTRKPVGRHRFEFIRSLLRVEQVSERGLSCIPWLSGINTSYKKMQRVLRVCVQKVETLTNLHD